MVLKLPLISALLTNGLHRYSGLLPAPSAEPEPGPLGASYGMDGIVGDFLGREERPMERKKFDMLDKAPMRGEGKTERGVHGEGWLH